MSSIITVSENPNTNTDGVTSAAENIASVSAQAPGKLILSGEHAVVYGFPAIAMAIDLYAISEVSKGKHNVLGFDFANLKYNAKHTINTLSKLKDKAFIDYQRFLQGECSIREVVNKPFELLQFAVSNFLDKLNIVLPGGIDIKTHSTIPSGCGLGSSAATIMSVLYAVGSLLDLNLSKARYIELGRAAENLQHGKSSGVDIQLSSQGGCIKFASGSIKELDIETKNMFLINTGRPIVTTGECVSHVKKYFNKSSKLGYEFADVTLELEKVLSNNDLISIIDIINENHKLLDYIGVVPDKVNNFISDINKAGLAAKVCGSGAVKGDNAGAVLAVCPDQDSINALGFVTKKYDYTMQLINIDSHGIEVS